MKSPSRPNPDLLRGELLKRGFTIVGFARRHDYKARTVKAAIRGERAGPVALKILAHIRRVTRHAA